MSASTTDIPTARRFRIALSFPGEHRSFVEQVAEHLAAAVGRDRVLYDKFYEAEFARPALDIYLQGLYHDESELIAVFLCADYGKEWCGLEWEAIRDLIKRRQVSSVMLLRFDNTEIPGLFSTAGHIWIGDRSPEDIAQRIIERLQLNSGQPTVPASPRLPISALEEPFEPKWTDELRIYSEGFVGRQEELSAMDRAWAEGVRIFALHAEGGAGKTRVVFEWLRRMRDDRWGGAKVFVHSFYSQGSDERRTASSELFFEQALAYFGYRGEPITQADERGRKLAALLVEHHGLLVLDGLEPLQHPPLHAEQGRLKDPGITRLLLSLASFPHDEIRGLCLITSRQPVVELQGRKGATVIQRSLDHLHRNVGAELLQQFQVVGPDEEFKKASDEFHGHAYSLMLLGSYLKNATDHHDLRRRSEVLLLEEDKEHSSHARKMFAAYVRHLGEDSPEVAVLRLLGFFDRAAERQLLDMLRAREGVVYEWPEEAEPTDKRPQPQFIEDSLAEITAPLLDLPQIQWHRVLNRLRDLRLISFTGSGTSPVVDAHPLLRECFAEQVRMQSPAAWQAGHQRLFEHLSGTVPYRPEGVEGLQPLYQAATHGCLAGLYQQALSDIYDERIQRGTGDGGFYSSKNLGMIGANLGIVACFFVTPWTTLMPDLAVDDQAWLLNEAAFALQGLGRLTEAAQPMRAGIEMAVEQGDWANAAIYSDNLSELELKRGEVAMAVTIGEQSVTYAERGENAFLQMASRSTQADALHQAGQRYEAQRLFEDAEAQQAARQPEYPWLYALQGFQYCDLLLADAERVAWQRCLLFSPSDRRDKHSEGSTADIRKPDFDLMLTASMGTACEAVSERAAYALEGAERHQIILDIARDHLTLSRAVLYNLHSAKFPNSAFEHVTAAVDGFRLSGHIDELPRGLLSRAWLQCLSGDETGCRADLDEAWEIADRGPMPLFQADIHLHRARLFRDLDALADARRLIEKHGYHRRDGELSDVIEAAKSW
ncbi:MAG TPA: hypothetical protein VKK31_32195 [Thermoanaerobaculia bacterium]|nr:hypothetical protein [Thermoanaerobaculia bacterium]